MHRHRPPRIGCAVVALLVALALPSGGAQAIAVTAVDGEALARDAPTSASRESWLWPVERPFAVTREYIAPTHDYGPGHRGIDLRPVRSTALRAPADGAVAFAGVVVDRPLVTIDHGDGFVTTLEPVVTELPPGTRVRAGEVIGMLHLGGHADPGTVHFGVRLHGEYINPLVLLGGVPRAVLLPCCE